VSKLTPQQEEAKRVMYEKLSARRKRFIDRIGYDTWDPFPEPFDPIDIRKDQSGMTVDQMVNNFLRLRASQVKIGPAYQKGVYDMAMGCMQRDDRYRGMIEFAAWYLDHLRQQGKDVDDVFGT